MNGNNQNLSIMKALDIIEYLADKNNEPQRMCDIAEALEMNISTVSRFLSSLVLRGYVRQDVDTARYFLSLRFCGIAERINANSQVYTLALPVMKEISSTVRESSSAQRKKSHGTANITAETGCTAEISPMCRSSCSQFAYMSRISAASPNSACRAESRMSFLLRTIWTAKISAASCAAVSSNAAE